MEQEVFVFPTSFAQQRLWFLDQLEPGTSAYTISAALRLTGPLNVAALAQSLNEIIRRHEALRTTFAVREGQPVQVITPTLSLPLLVVDLQALPETQREAEVGRLATAEAQQLFDLTQGPLLRATLLQLSDEKHVLLLTLHHIAADGWSVGVFSRELAALYEAFSMGQPSPLPQLPIQYADFAVWQRQWLQGERLEQQLAYWKQQLQGLPVLELPTDRPRPAVQTYQGARETLRLPPASLAALKELSRQEGVTLFMTLLAAFKVLLSRYTGQEDIVVGMPIAGRTRVELEELIGFFINTLVLRTDLSGDPSFRELLRRVREVALGAYAHQELPFEKLVEELQPERNLSRPPLFQVFFNLLTIDDGEIKLPGLTITTLLLPEIGSKFDLTLYAREQHEGIELALAYNTNLFEAATITWMLEHLQTLLDSILLNPAQRLSLFSLLSETERNQLSTRGNVVRPVTPFIPFPIEESTQSIQTRFEQQVKQHPRNVAVKTKHYEWTYEELNREANRVAQTILMRCRSGTERIALVFEHDAPMIASLLGVVKAGKTYVPLDPAYPQERLAYILRDSQASAILTNKSNAAFVKVLAKDTAQLINIDDIDSTTYVENISLPTSPDALAYLLYTSGSTGRPKGVMQSHHNVLYHISNYTNNLHINAEDRLTLLSSYSFDAAVMDILGALLNGATLYPMNINSEDLVNLSAWLVKHEITIYHSTPTVYRYFVSTLTGEEEFPKLRLVILGGEEVQQRDVERYKKHFSPECILVNGLGPTESTVSLQYFVDKQTAITRHTVPVGYPVEGTEIVLLNTAGEKSEIYGEIAIRSPHIALGYWQKLELTEAVFLPDPGGGTRRIYRTGDMGRLLPDGGIMFMGRRDLQVKLHGFRIELGEIEAVLGQHPAVRKAAVRTWEDGFSDKRLVAYIVPTPEVTPTVSELRRFLQTKLPEYMVPSAFIVLDALPLTPNGKLDRRALPAPAPTRPELETVFVAPRTHVEEALVKLWAQVLSLNRLGIHDNFFALGGHSLLATQVISRLRDLFQVEVSLRRLFETPTIAELAVAIEQAHESKSALHTPAISPTSRELHRVNISSRGV